LYVAFGNGCNGQVSSSMLRCAAVWCGCFGEFRIGPSGLGLAVEVWSVLFVSVRIGWGLAVEVRFGAVSYVELR